MLENPRFVLWRIVSAVDNGKVPQSIMDDVVRNLKATDNKEETIRKVHKG